MWDWKETCTSDIACMATGDFQTGAASKTL